MNQTMPDIERKFLIPALLLLFAAIAGYVLTGQAYWLAAPFIFLFFIVIYTDWKLVYWSMLCLVPLSRDVYFSGGSLSLSFPAEPMMWTFLLLLPVLWTYRPGMIPSWWWSSPIVLVVLLQLCWLLIAVADSEVVFLSVKFLLAKLWCLSAFFVFPLFLFREKRDFKKGFLLMFVPVMLTVFIIFTRQVLQDFDFSKVARAVGDLYFNHVEYSTVISMLFPVLCVAYPLSRGMKKWIRVCIVLLILFFLPVIYLSYARAAVLAILFAALVALAIRYRLVNFIMPVFYAAIILMISYFSQENKYIDLRPNYDHTYMHANFSDHLVATFKGQDMSSMERLYRWIAAMRMSTERPLTGFGPHAFTHFYKSYTLSIFKTYVSDNPEHSTTHNYFLYMLVEQGWPAMILYALLIMVVFAEAQRIYHRFIDRFWKYCTLGLAMSFAACFVNNFFSELLETSKVGALFYLSISLLVILDHKSRQERHAQQQLLQ